MTMKLFVAAIAGCLFFKKACCWSTQIPFHHRHLNIRTVLHGSKNEATSSDSDRLNQIIKTANDAPPAATYGVSYIGGDPCGSKYNDDPFDASVDVVKPGMPDEMKIRIAAMAAEILKKGNDNDEN